MIHRRISPEEQLKIFFLPQKGKKVCLRLGDVKAAYLEVYSREMSRIFFYFFKSLNYLICTFLFLQGVLFFTHTSYLLLIIVSFNPFPPVYLLILWPPNPLNSRVLFIILIGKGKIDFTAEFSNRILLSMAVGR